MFEEFHPELIRDFGLLADFDFQLQVLVLELIVLVLQLPVLALELLMIMLQLCKLSISGCLVSLMPRYYLGNLLLQFLDLF